MFKFIKRRRAKKELLQLDLYASATIINPLLQKMSRTVTFNQYSIRPSSLGMLINDLLINGRTNYLEFGGGISTFLIAKVIQLNGLNGRVTVIDHDEKWVSFMNEFLGEEGLAKYVKVYHVPLAQSNSPFGLLSWYGRKEVDKILAGKEFDMVLVDGPPGRGGHHRYPAVPVLMENQALAKSHSVYLDDCGRKPELAILDKWASEFGMSFDIIHRQFGAHHSGDSMKIKLLN